jgi:prepilin-type processing-associated H-X9-DG protein/prepilin-type N-terminal cleavage/methylation domain-containing protein
MTGRADKIYEIRRDRTHAFTLVEVLATAAILLIVAGILLPVASKMKQQGTSAKCISNLHQIGVGYGAYILESKGTLPLPHDDNRVFYTWSGEPAGIAMVVEAGYLSPPPVKYSMDIKDKGIYACPGLTPLDHFVAGGDQISYRVDSRNGRYRIDIGGSGVNYTSFEKFWELNASKRAQVACSDPSAHGSHINVVYLDGHVEAMDSEKTREAYASDPACDFSKLDKK